MNDFVKDLKSASFNSSTPESSKQIEDGDNIKVKFLEVWNNFKFEISDHAKLRKDSPLWLLGQCYHLQSVDKKESLLKNFRHLSEEKCNHFTSFLIDFLSRPWFTYRKGFSALNDTTLTSDTGWGCMLRSTQMMVAQCLITHFLGREWRWFNVHQKSTEVNMHCEVIKWFVDESNPKCPFSIHRLTEIGLNYRCKPGEWYGPGTVAYIMQDAMECAKGVNSELNELVVYVAQDCTVYTSDVKEMCHWGKYSMSQVAHSASDSDVEKMDNRSVIILIPVRLGESTLNPIYSPCLKSILTLDQSMGIIGGKPRHSLYFIGFQDDYLIYLDPHYCQPSDTLSTFSNKNLKSYHSSSPRKTNVLKLDPSCCLCFYCRDENEFDSFVGEINKFLAPPKQKTHYPLCLILEGSSRDYNLRTSIGTDSCVINTSQDSGEKFCEVVTNSKGSSEFQQDLPVTDDISENSSARSLVAQNFTNSEKSLSGIKVPLKSPEKSKEKTENFSFSIAKPSRVLANFYRQHINSLKTNSNVPDTLEEDFEFL